MTLIVVILIFLLCLGIFLILKPENINYDVQPIITLLPNHTKIIWTFWHNLDDSPTIVKTNFEFIQKKYPDWVLIVLTNENISYYVDTDIIKLVKAKGITHKTDLYRLYVLKNHGGLWIDSSVIIQDSDFINKLYDTCLKNGKIALFHTNFVGLESWFIMSPCTDHYIITAWYIEFLKANIIGFKEYRRLIEKQIDNYIYDTFGLYLTIHACLKILIEQHPTILDNIIIHKSEDSMFFIQKQINWNSKLYRDAFLNLITQLPCIKLRGEERKIMHDFNVNTLLNSI